MGKQISLNLPDDLLHRAELLAGRSGRGLAEVLTEAIETSLDPLGFGAPDTSVMTNGSNDEVIAAADSMMAEQDDRRLGDLLDAQQVRALSTAEANELRALMQVYQEGMLRKAEGLREAVRRGLRGAPAS